MQTFTIRTMTEKYRARWVYDEDHQTRGSYYYDTEAETKAAEDNEIASLESGAWSALGCIIEKRCKACYQWEQVESCWGIVTPTDDECLDSIARDLLPCSD